MTTRFVLLVLLTVAFEGYAHQYVYALDAGHCDRNVREQTLPEALEWVWRGYEAR